MRGRRAEQKVHARGRLFEQFEQLILHERRYALERSDDVQFIFAFRRAQHTFGRQPRHGFRRQLAPLGRQDLAIEIAFGINETGDARSLFRAEKRFGAFFEQRAQIYGVLENEERRLRHAPLFYGTINRRRP